jgi:HAD superfamily hydrolase (TIGR01509 family)
MTDTARRSDAAVEQDGGEETAGATGVLFDVDGTLVDTTYVHAVCWSEALRQNGHDVPMSTVHHHIGMSTQELLGALLGEDRDREQDDTLDDAHKTLYKQYWGRLRPLPGAAEVLRRCASEGLTVVLASSASAEELTMLRSVIDADDAIAVTTGKDDADAGKPEPDIVQVALAKSGVAPDRALFVGDARWDGIAAGRAGVPFLGVTCGGTAEDELRRAGAVEVYRDPAQLVERFVDTVLGRVAEAAR